MENPTLQIHTDQMNPPANASTLIDARQIAYQNCNTVSSSLITILVVAYNRLEKTKRCVESILNYTQGIDYELLLVDNGSSDGTLAYFQNVPYQKTTVWKITHNVGLSYALALAMRYFHTEYFVSVSNDVYVTKNWLNNLLYCMQSDPTIGFVCPVSSHISNLQEVEIKAANFEDMQEKAARFNRSDPRKWQERMRIISIILMVKREVCDTVGVMDMGFYHDFGDDDISTRIRRAGYKLMLCGDTYVYHDHDFRNLEDKDPEQFQASINLGRKNYQEKYHGIDAWEDINNFEIPMMRLLEQTSEYPDCPDILCVDPRCGTPVLQARNMLRAKGILNCTSSAFTTKAKYFHDLQFVTEERTICDRIDFLAEHYREESFDIILLGEPVNTYPEPLRVTENLFRCLRKGGKLLVKLRNTASAVAYLNLLGIQQSVDGDMPLQISEAVFHQCLNLMQVKRVQQVNCMQSIPQETLEVLKNGLRASNLCENPEQAVQRMNIWEYVYLIEK